MRKRKLLCIFGEEDLLKVLPHPGPPLIQGKEFFHCLVSDDAGLLFFIANNCFIHPYPSLLKRGAAFCLTSILLLIANGGKRYGLKQKKSNKAGTQSSPPFQGGVRGR